MTKAIALTAADRMILASYHTVLDGLAHYLGSAFEFVLHSLEDLEHSAVKVINGQHSNRAVGAPITDLALRMLEDIQQKPGGDRNRVYANRSKKGSPIRAATLPVMGENERVIGLICINFYLDTPLNELLGQLLKPGEENGGVSESLASNAEDLIAHSLSEAIAFVNASGITWQNRNKAIISHLFAKGMFRLKNAVPKVADMMGISQNTVYLHLRKLKKEARRHPGGAQ